MDEMQRSEGGFGWFFNHLPVIMRQRRNWIIWPFVALTLAATIAAFALPTQYRSTASLLVQSQALPSTVVQAPTAGDIEQRIARIRQRVLSRGDLIRVIEQNDLYADERRSEPLSKIVEKMRKATTVGAQVNDLGAQAGTQDTIAIDISFDYPDPRLAQTVLQTFVDSFLTQDTQDVSDQARLSVRFLDDQANRLRSQISAIEGRLTELKARNGAALASSGMPGMVDLGSYTTQIASLESQNRQLMAQAGRGSGSGSTVANAEAALAAARAVYNDSHPDVRAAKERLQVARQLAQSNTMVDETAIIRSQVAANNSAIASLQAARSAAMARSQAALAGSARAPAILEQAMQLENQASTLRDQYKSVADDLLKAQNAARLANEQRAERLSLVETPSLPDTPYSPNRPLLIGVAALAGLFLGLVLALGVEFLRKTIRSPSQIEAMGLPIIGVVPVLGEPDEPSKWAFWKRRKPKLA